jgi:hypothetical protein
MRLAKAAQAPIQRSSVEAHQLLRPTSPSPLNRGLQSPSSSTVSRSHPLDDLGLNWDPATHTRIPHREGYFCQVSFLKQFHTF